MNEETLDEIEFDVSEDALFSGLDIADPWALATSIGVSLPEIPMDAMGGALSDITDLDENNAPEVTDEDYAPEEWFFFNAIRKQIRSACNRSSSPTTIRLAIEWLFVRGAQDNDGFQMHLCCEMLRCRPAVVQARIQHQFYALARNMDFRLPVLADELPRSIQIDIENTIAPGDPIKLAKVVWNWPGIRADILKSDLDLFNFSNTLKALEAEGYIALKNGCVFFITRNFDYLSLRERRMFRWSTVIFGES